MTNGWQAQWIDCVIDMVEIEKRDGASHMGSHWVFCRKVLGEPKADAVAIAGRFQHVALTREACEKLAEDWFRCECCGGAVAGGVRRCEHCEADDVPLPSTRKATR